MKKGNESSLGQIIGEFLETYRLNERLNELKIVTAWQEVMDPSISKRTSEIKFRDGILYLGVTSAPLREELTFQKERIRTVLNRELAGEVIREVVIR